MAGSANGDDLSELLKLFEVLGGGAVFDSAYLLDLVVGNVPMLLEVFNNFCVVGKTTSRTRLVAFGGKRFQAGFI